MTMMLDIPRLQSRFNPWRTAREAVESSPLGKAEGLKFVA